MINGSLFFVSLLLASFHCISSRFFLQLLATDISCSICNLLPVVGLTFIFFFCSFMMQKWEKMFTPKICSFHGTLSVWSGLQWLLAGKWKKWFLASEKVNKLVIGLIMLRVIFFVSEIRSPILSWNQAVNLQHSVVVKQCNVCFG